MLLQRVIQFFWFWRPRATNPRCDTDMQIMLSRKQSRPKKTQEGNFCSPTPNCIKRIRWRNCSRTGALGHIQLHYNMNQVWHTGKNVAKCPFHKKCLEWYVWLWNKRLFSNLIPALIRFSGDDYFVQILTGSLPNYIWIFEIYVPYDIDVSNLFLGNTALLEFLWKTVLIMDCFFHVC